MAFNVREKIDHKLWKTMEKHEFPQVTIIICEHSANESAKYPNYLAYAKFDSLPIAALITSSNIDDLPEMNDWNPSNCIGKDYQEIAIKFSWNWELWQVISAFKHSGLWAYPTEEEIEIEALKEIE